MKRLLVTGVVAGLLATGATAAITAVSASGTPSSSPAPGARPRHHPFPPRNRVAGKVLDLTTTGGSRGYGYLVLSQPNGSQLDIEFAARTKAFSYQGLGIKPSSESLGSIQTGEVVIAGTVVVQGTRYAARILDLGINAGG